MNGTKEIPINSFQSTSIAREVSDRYPGHVQGESVMMIIRLKKGTHCVDVSRISSAPNPEKEILLGSSGKYSTQRVYYDEASKQLAAEVVYDR